MSVSDVEKLEALLHSSFPILVIETEEESRALLLLERAARSSGFGVQTWSICQGFKRLGKAVFKARAPSRLSLVGERVADQSLDQRDPQQALQWASDQLQDSLLILMDFHPYLSDPKVVRQLKELALGLAKHGNRVVLISHAIDTPPEVRKLAQPFSFSMPNAEQLAKLVDQEASLHVARGKAQGVQIDPKARELLISNLIGVTYSDAERLIRNAIHTDDAITQSDLPEVTKAKYALISNNGALSFEYDTANFDQIGGFANLKQWVDKRREAIVSGGEGRDRPKGAMLLGVQGCGKSLAARAIAGQLGVPLIRLDMGAIYNKYIGESERNVRELLKAADVMAPCVLWIDEIEKGISGSNDESSGAPRRVLGTLLTWMQEARSGVFTVATANDIESLPPELMRKGRMDEVFFVDLPNFDNRKAIVQTILRKRELPEELFDLDQVAHASDGFSGAEIEQAVVSSLYSVTSDHAIGTRDVVHEMNLTQPLSVVRRESIEYLRNWAKDRTVSVDL
ncbi:MAG: AAA family ATPase [Granulosicoccaceae bacterium]